MVKMVKLCLNCGKEIPSRNKYCENICQNKYEYKQYIEKWLKGEKDGIKGKSDVSNHIRRYLFDKYNSKCCKCGWGVKNEYSGLIPLQVHHIDGDCLNNKEANLELLCPNCHALTDNYGSLNKNSMRIR